MLYQLYDLTKVSPLQSFYNFFMNIKYNIQQNCTTVHTNGLIKVVQKHINKKIKIIKSFTLNKGTTNYYFRPTGLFPFL